MDEFILQLYQYHMRTAQVLDLAFQETPDVGEISSAKRYSSTCTNRRKFKDLNGWFVLLIETA